ncbi:MAG: F510_1955 family glycosylhydrolase [Candidatus Nitrosotenuis sp.]
MTKPSKNKLAITGIIVIIIGIGVSISLFQNETTESNSDPRTVFWRHIHGLGIEPADRNVLYIATHGDFYQSVNGGPPLKVDEQRADYMAFNAPYSQGIPLYASGHPATGGNTGLIKSTDGGKTWQQVATVLEPPVDFHAMAVSKSDSNLIIGFDSAGRGLFKTTDAGQSWQKLEFSEYVSALTISPSDTNVIFAGTGKGIFVSNDGANTWTNLGQYDDQLVFALNFDENGILYASTDGSGLAKSSDIGQTWEKIKSPNLTVMSIAVDAQNNVLYIAGYVPDGFQEVHKSSDDGNTWDLIGTNKES